MKIRRYLVLAGLLACAFTLSAQGKGKGKGKGSEAHPAPTASPAVSVTAVSVTVSFGANDQRVMREWVQATPSKGLPPGLAKRGELPPGLQKQLAKNGTLPPGLQKKLSPFPAQLNAQLTPLPPGCNCDRVFLDGKALIVARVSHAILDILSLF